MLFAFLMATGSEKKLPTIQEENPHVAIATVYISTQDAPIKKRRIQRKWDPIFFVAGADPKDNEI